MTNIQNIQLKKTLLRLPNGQYISPYTDCKGAMEVGDIGQSLFVDESEGLRRKLNGQTVAINTNTQVFVNKLKTLKLSYPTLFCTEDEWQEIRLNNCLSQVGKFVLQEDETQVREQYNVGFVGQIAKNHGVVSGFLNNTNSLILQEVLPWSSATSINIQLKLNIESISVSNVLLGNTGDTATGNGIVLRTDGAARIYLWGTNNGSSWTTSQNDTGIDLSIGVNYIQINFDGTNFVVSKSLDGQNWTTGTSLPTGVFTDCKQWIGSTGSGSALYTRGSIDLTESFFRVNGQTWCKPYELVEETVEPYVRLPRVVNLQGTLDLTRLGEISNTTNRRLVAQRKPTLDDTRWYNWYSDGWLEQGGYVLQNRGTNASWTTYQIWLLKPYKDVLYNVWTVTGHTDYTSAPSVWSKDTQSFYCRPYNNSGEAQWSSWGYGTIPTPEDYNIENAVDGDVQFPYFIQISQGQHTLTTIRNEWEINNPYTLFDGKQSQYPLNNTSWLESKGQWNEKSIYTSAYEALLVELNDSIPTNTTVDLPSGGKYTKHLQTVNFDIYKVDKINEPIIENAILKHSPEGGMVRMFLNQNTMNTANKWTFKMRFRPTLDGGETASAPILFTTKADDYTEEEFIMMSFMNNKFMISSSVLPYQEISKVLSENLWYDIRVSFDDATGYKFELSEDEGTTYVTLYSSSILTKVALEDNYIYFRNNYWIDLRTVQFAYTKNNVDYLITCGTEYKSTVWDKAEHTTSELDYAYNFIVDRINETFRLPIYDRIYNNAYADLYYYVGDTAQNTSLIDVGRITSSVADINSQLEQMRDVINRMSGNVPTVETSTYTYKYVTLYNGIDAGDHAFDLSSYIPLDGHEYDVSLCLYWYVGDTSGTNRGLYVYNADKSQLLARTITDGISSPNTGAMTANVIVPLPANSRAITLTLSGATSGTTAVSVGYLRFYMQWFRKY